MDASPRVAARSPLTALSEAAREDAVQRFALLRPHLEEGVPLTRIAQTHGIPVRTLHLWLRAYRTAGLAGLTRKARADRGQHRLPAPLVELIQGLVLRRPRPSVAAIYRQLVTVAGDQGWPVPAYSTVTAIVRRLDPALLTLAHNGAKAYGNAFDLVYRRTAGRPNELWQADHTPLDLWVLDHQGKPVRPWLTVVMDDFSRAIAGYALNLSAPSALQTSLALRQAIWRKGEPGWHICGIPDAFYTDHGSDFTSQHLEQVATDITMQLVFSTPGVPRGRGKIERFFGTVNQLFLCMLPGYTPPGTAPPAAPTLTLSDLDARFRAFLIDQYHRRLHSETGKAPQTRWEEGAFLPRLPDSLEQLDLLLLTVATPRKVHPDGIHFAGVRYLDLTLAAYVGEAVTIRYDPRDLAELRVYFQDRFLCRAVCPELASQTISLKDLIRARGARRRELRQFVAARISIADQLLPPPHAASQPALDTDARPRLKRYLND